MTNFPPPRVLNRGFEHFAHGVDGELRINFVGDSSNWLSCGLVGVLSGVVPSCTGGLLLGVEGGENVDTELELSVRSGVNETPPSESRDGLVGECDVVLGEPVSDLRSRRRSMSSTVLFSARGEGL